MASTGKGRHTSPGTEFKKGHPAYFPGWKEFTPKHRENMSKAQLGRKNPAHGERIRALWKTSDFAAKQRTGRSQGPNRSEKNLNCLLSILFPGEYLYTGDFSFMVDGKNPDFVSTKETKKVIEFFGNRFHKKEDEEKRIEFFRTHGCSCVVIWQDELKDLGSLVDKLRCFHEEK